MTLSKANRSHVCRHLDDTGMVNPTSLNFQVPSPFRPTGTWMCVKSPSCLRRCRCSCSSTLSVPEWHTLGLACRLSRHPPARLSRRLPVLFALPALPRRGREALGVWLGPLTSAPFDGALPPREPAYGLLRNLLCDSLRLPPEFMPQSVSGALPRPEEAIWGKALASQLLLCAVRAGGGSPANDTVTECALSSTLFVPSTSMVPLECYRSFPS
mmetsp:Transcript_5504/g.13360  ORF Transcript_5504/g.13360 Transcript_5504/m.13360 type:complete len:213 (+) Transcript_5504:1877-2515(+)